MKTNETHRMMDIGENRKLDLNSIQLIDMLPCYITVQDTSMHIIFANHAFKKDFGDKVGDFCHFAYKNLPTQCDDCPVQRTLKDKKLHFSEETVQTRDGFMCQLLVHSAPIFDREGNVAAVIEMATNITKIKEIQKELITLGNSIAMLSHSIKNILEGLQGGAYVVDEAIKDGNMKLANKGWRIVKKNITDITDVTQNILYSSKSRNLNYQKVSPGDIVKESVGLFQEKASSMDVKLKYKINEKLPLVLLDKFSILRVLNNFVWNALEACWRDKKNVIHEVIVRADFLDEKHFFLEVSDNGTGMDKETMKHIFEEFYSTKGAEGTGLGLAVAEKIIFRHGGKKEVESELGKGSTFRVILSP